MKPDLHARTVAVLASIDQALEPDWAAIVGRVCGVDGMTCHQCQDPVVTTEDPWGPILCAEDLDWCEFDETSPDDWAASATAWANGCWADDVAYSELFRVPVECGDKATGPLGLCRPHLNALRAVR